MKKYLSNYDEYANMGSHFKIIEEKLVFYFFKDMKMKIFLSNFKQDVLKNYF